MFTKRAFTSVFVAVLIAFTLQEAAGIPRPSKRDTKNDIFDRKLVISVKELGPDASVAPTPGDSFGGSGAEASPEAGQIVASPEILGSPEVTSSGASTTGPVTLDSEEGNIAEGGVTSPSPEQEASPEVTSSGDSATGPVTINSEEGNIAEDGDTSSSPEQEASPEAEGSLDPSAEATSGPGLSASQSGAPVASSEPPTTGGPSGPSGPSGPASTSTTRALPTTASPSTSQPVTKPKTNDTVNGSETAASNCFPGTATAELESGEFVRMDDLRVGDRVLVGPNRYAEVFMFTHKIADSFHEFVRIETSSGHALSLSAGHYVYVNGATLAAAQSVKLGESLTLEGGARTIVTSISRTVEQGLYNPQTTHGDIVVNGILASTYTTSVAPAIAHGMLFPLRAIYWLSGYSSQIFDSGADCLAALAPKGLATYR